ncbi:claudin-1 [Gracilinanus agilis]|uniref:claudin-1 n=1 Tax=Gracilinanus agilis TaxID=191870 RepID=UPI001CFE0D5D|nr:claudin-1 [Gracilinanus agilis]
MWKERIPGMGDHQRKCQVSGNGASCGKKNKEANGTETENVVGESEYLVVIPELRAAQRSDEEGGMKSCPRGTFYYFFGTLQATRALMVIGIILGLIAILVATVGMKCMKCLEDDEVQKMRMAVFGGMIFLVAGLAVLVATAWYGNRVAREFYDPMTPVNFRYEFGQALFIGWAAASLCLLGGALLCCSCPKKTTSYPTPRPYPKTTPSSGKDYV